VFPRERGAGPPFGCIRKWPVPIAALAPPVVVVLQHGVRLADDVDPDDRIDGSLRAARVNLPVGKVVPVSVEGGETESALLSALAARIDAALATGK
jgi:hypothetical protein